MAPQSRLVRDLPAAVNHGEVFTTADAGAAGWTMSALKNAVRTGRIRRVRAGVYIARAADEPGSFRNRERDLTTEAVAAARTITGCILTHRSAALMHGLPVLSMDRTCITVAATSGRTLPRLNVHRAPLPPAFVRPLNGVAVSTVARTIIDLAREHGFEEAVAAGDAALRLKRVDRREMYAALEQCRQWPGSKAARSAIHFCDGRSESVLESLSRVRISRHDLPAPELQAELRDRFGRFVGRVDFLFVELGVVGEADGLAKYSTRGVDEHEQRRRQRIENLGYGFVRWQAADLRNFEVIADRIRHTARHLTPRRPGALPPPGWDPWLTPGH